MNSFNNFEVILNLWYVHGDDDLIYSLRVRPYIGGGSDEDKLSFLQEMAKINYLIAQPFPIPTQFHVTVSSFLKKNKMPVAARKTFPSVESMIVLFEDSIKEVEKGFPVQSNVSISQNPIVCITPLRGDDKGNIYPVFTRTERF